MKPPDGTLVVTGLPRSGTSLAMQMLAAGGLAPHCDGTRASDAGNPRGYFEHAEARDPARIAALARAARGHALKLVAPLVMQLPDDPALRFLWMRRATPAVLASQARWPGATGEPATVELLDAVLAALERWLHEHAPGRWLRLDYEAVLADPERAARDLAGFLPGLDAGAAARVVDPALRRSG